MKKWGNNYSEPGFFPVIAVGGWTHFAGGRDWRFEGASGDDLPCILLDLNLRDPRLHHVGQHEGRLPLASRVNSSSWSPRQEYTFSTLTRTVKWDTPKDDYGVYAREDRMPFPTDAVGIDLVSMGSTDCPLTEGDYWRIGDEFLGGSKFIRIMGSPYWLQEPILETCRCGSQMTLVASVGHEALDSDGIFYPKPFFIGEAALYFFGCMNCCRINVVAQST